MQNFVAFSEYTNFKRKQRKIPQNFELTYYKWIQVKFVYSEKATKFCEISTLLLSTVHTDKSKVEISKIFVAFSEYMNFTFSK